MKKPHKNHIIPIKVFYIFSSSAHLLFSFISNYLSSPAAVGTVGGAGGGVAKILIS
jgi:hypothetical protein